MKRMEVVFWGYEHKSVDASIKQILNIARSAGSPVRGPIPLPTRKKIFTVLRGVHKHKDSREQFQMSSHKRLLVIFPNSKTIDELKRFRVASSVNISIKLT